MNILKMIKALLAKGFATKAEKEALKASLKELGAEDQETVAEEVAEVEALPETDEASDDEVTKQLNSLMKGVKDETIAEVKKAFAEYVAKEKELAQKQVGIYSPEAKDVKKSLNAKLKAMTLALLRNDDSFMKAKELTTDATSSPYGGYVVDSELSAEIRHLVTEYGVARKEMLALQLTKNSYKANDLVTDITTYWVDEQSTITSGQVVLGQETLELKKIGAIVVLSSELIADEEIDLFGFVGGRVAEGMARKEDEAFFNGDGTSTYGSFTGLLNNASVNEVVLSGSTFASMTADDLLDMIDATPQGAQANGKFYMHRTIRSIVKRLKNDENTYIYQMPSENGPATIWGKPVVEVEAMPSSTDTAEDTSFVLYGDLKKACILGYKGAIEAKRFDAGIVRNVANNADINLISQDSEAMRFIERAGYIVILPTAVTKLTTAEASV